MIQTLFFPCFTSRRFPSYLLSITKTVLILLSVNPSLIFLFRLLPSPVHLTGFSFYMFPDFLVIFILLSSTRLVLNIVLLPSNPTPRRFPSYLLLIPKRLPTYFPLLLLLYFLFIFYFPGASCWIFLLYLPRFPCHFLTCGHQPVWC